ncbi:MAG: pyruvate ferredoxin oxidoreductase, partial [Thermoplasmata archaeon]|nr:pyruvate ferredoxin oxidoreductase [Thermoplasmata archaeon]NIS12859.1 pyruvate ferredoxin oxidoreductase [Thermoplasmata archaeon]NIS20766.1 pyruvate ferredoxin oxidoreductase [Thermoplasmata archaeon]NIT78175.1 pyruvate ferredoxin oxidoreductase [Thermoplasmata archaeon]NIU49837.1 pyruvate ferredoxin oxidoreductase [Thermoplasmata archaeon]
EGAISALPLDEEGKKTGVQVDYDYCKGCGICANECPKQAYEMVPEEK